jgi:hypothetical protein
MARNKTAPWDKRQHPRISWEESMRQFEEYVNRRKQLVAEHVAVTEATEARAERLDKLIECRCVLPEHVCPACRAAATTGLEPDEIPFT